jgi:hypothetical protein
VHPFTYDAANHLYRYGGRVVRGVSSVLAAGGLITAAAYYTHEARWRGTRVHDACLRLDLGVFDASELMNDEEAGCLESYGLWREMVRPRWKHLEEARYSKRYDFGGTADRVGFDGQGRPLVLDFKTGGREPWHALQLALYDLLYDDIPPRIRRRVTLYLKRDGSIARGFEYSNPSDYDRALRLLKAA